MNKEISEKYTPALDINNPYITFPVQAYSRILMNGIAVANTKPIYSLIFATDYNIMIQFSTSKILMWDDIYLAEPINGATFIGIVKSGIKGVFYG